MVLSVTGAGANVVVDDAVVVVDCAGAGGCVLVVLATVEVGPLIVLVVVGACVVV